MTGLLSPLKHALRALLRAPGFSLAVLVTLTLGIGLHSAMLSVFDRLVARPLPLRNLDRLVALYDADTRLGWTHNFVSANNFTAYAARSRSLDALAAFTEARMILGAGGEAERIPGTQITHDFFRALGIQPLLGRAFTGQEDLDGGPRVVILGHTFWRNRLGGDPGILGRTLPLDGIPHEVVGILPPGRRLESLTEGQVFVPVRWDPEALARRRGGHAFNALGRLAPGVTLAQADADQKRIARELISESPLANPNASATVGPLVELANGDTRELGLVLLALSTFLLLIACANASNLMLARGIQRRHDLAVRSALGAARRALVLDMLRESLLLGLAGALGGLGLGHGLLTVVRRLFPDNALLQTVGTDAWTLGFALGTTLAAVLLASLVPVWRLSRVAPAEVLKEGAKGSTGLSQRRFQAALMVVQVSVSMVLLTGAGLMLRSLARLGRVETGFRAEGLLTARVDLPRGAYGDPEARLGFLARLEEGLRDLPGAKGAGVASFLLLGSSGNNQDIWPVGSERLPGSQNITWTHQVSPGFFRTAGIPVLQGGVPDHPDPGTCVVNATFVKRHGLGNAAVGRLLAIDRRPNGSSFPYRIVGVVGDVRNLGLEEDFKPQVYTFLVPGAVTVRGSFTVYASTAGSPMALAGVLRAAIRRAEPGAAVTRLQTMAQAVERSKQERSATTQLFLDFGGLGLVLAGVGFYGLMAYLVAQRNRELGIRAALGASGSRILAEVFRLAFGLVGVGLALGALLSLALARYLSSQLYRVSAMDPVSMGLAALALCAVAGTAALLPALRAARVDPVAALRNE